MTRLPLTEAQAWDLGCDVLQAAVAGVEAALGTVERVRHWQGREHRSQHQVRPGEVYPLPGGFWRWTLN